jgi:hypothetical protein
LRNVSSGDLIQTIGRALRLHTKDINLIQSGKLRYGDFKNYSKSVGVISVPVNDSRGDKIYHRLNSVIDSLFNSGDIFIT